MGISRDQFADHLKFFEELGVAGYRRDADWARRREEPQEAPADPVEQAPALSKSESDPTKPAELGAEELNKGGGTLFIGTKGKLLHDTYGFNPRLLPKSLHDSVDKPPETIARIPTSHEVNWVDAIRGTQKTSTPFEYSAKLTEIMLLGVVALNAGRKIDYNGANMKITNVPDSDALLKRAYRAGWELG